MLMQIQVQCYYKVHMLIAKTTTLLLKITRIKEKNTEMILQSKAVKGKITTILQQSITENEILLPCYYKVQGSPPLCYG